MDPGFRQQQHQHHFQDQRRQLHQQKQQMNSGLTRFRSAPSSYFASFLDAAADTINSTTTPDAGGGGGPREDFSNARPLSPETEKIFANFMSSMGGESNSSSNQKLCDIPENSAVQQDFMVQVKQERETQQQQQHYHHHQQHQQGNYSTSSQQMIYQSQSKPPLANQNTSAMENQFRSTAATSMGMHSLPQMSNNNNNNNNNTNSSLTRHSSSPAGFFNSILLDIDNGYGAMKGMGNYGANTGETNFSQGQPSSTAGLMTQNSDIAGKRFSNSTNNNSSNNDRNYISGYPMSSWDDSILSENFSSLDRGGEDDGTQSFSELNASENQSKEGRNCPQPLAHHLSLPSSSAMEKMLQFQDTVPCRIRAKRGCATHPRSIAERVRRTRISERMRKLQDLVPSMDKQTNTADMLDLAVEYIKDLQNQVKNLNDQREKCTCSK